MRCVCVCGRLCRQTVMRFYLQSLCHVFKAVQHLIRWWEGCSQSDFSDDAIQTIHVADQQTRALIVTGWTGQETNRNKTKKQTHINKK